MTDAGMEKLGRFRGLESLILDGTQITGACANELGRLTNLQSLSLCDTHLTTAKVLELEQKLTDCDIILAGRIPAIE